MCRDVHCENPDHLQKISDYTHHILESISRCVNKNIPRTGEGPGKNKKDKTLPGWNDHVKSFKEDADF